MPVIILKEVYDIKKIKNAVNQMQREYNKDYRLREITTTEYTLESPEYMEHKIITGKEIILELNIIEFERRFLVFPLVSKSISISRSIRNNTYIYWSDDTSKILAENFATVYLNKPKAK